MQETKKRSVDLRKQHNADLIRRMRNGEPLNTIDSKASWYPPRPLIKKDVGDMARVYGAAPVPTAKGPTLATQATKGVTEGTGVAKVVKLETQPPRLPTLDEAG